MNDCFNWTILGAVADIGGSHVILAMNFPGTAGEALEFGWGCDTTPELIDVWCVRSNSHVIDEYHEPERVVLDNSEGKFKWQVAA